MAGTFTNLIYHVGFSTKHRRPLIKAAWQDELYAYIGGVVSKSGGISLATGGLSDHIHLLARLKPVDSVSDMVRRIKANSSRWVNDTGRGACKFRWQTGYGAFSVSESKVSAVRDYIGNQERHHRKISFQDEFRRLLEQHGVDFDERYLWG